jgi:hypothetical protein
LATTFLAGLPRTSARTDKAEPAPSRHIQLQRARDAEGSRTWGNLMQGIKLRR